MSFWNSLMENLSQDYVRTARAKGLSEKTVLFRHALRNGLPPLLTVMGLQFGNPDRPEADNLLGIYAILSGRGREAAAQ